VRSSALQHGRHARDDREGEEQNVFLTLLACSLGSLAETIETHGESGLIRYLAAREAVPARSLEPAYRSVAGQSKAHGMWKMVIQGVSFVKQLASQQTRAERPRASANMLCRGQSLCRMKKSTQQGGYPNAFPSRRWSMRGLRKLRPPTSTEYHALASASSAQSARVDTIT
jgi:hypothetical protein